VKTKLAWTETTPASPNKHYGEHHKVTEQEENQRTLREKIWKAFQIQPKA